jgi:single-stranded-DNA-specific exonuclease
MYKYLQTHKLNNIEYKINIGKVHGISHKSVDDFDNIDILIIVDSIDLNYDLYDKLSQKGIQIVILDHHDFYKYPENATLVSSAKYYPNKHLSGAGVVWKFCAYLDTIFNQNNNCYTFSKELIDLCACGILADVCDMSEDSMENRYLVSCGLKNIQNKGIKAILGNYEFNSQAVLWSIAPLVNAANRTCNNELAVKLFLTDDEKELKKIVKELKVIKEKQDVIVNEEYNLIELQINQNMNNNDKVIYGIVKDAEFSGLIATKVCNNFQKPCIVLHFKEDDSEDIKGSIRGYAVNDFKTVINNSGLAVCAGHENAAGITVKKSNISKLIDYINEEYKYIEFTTTFDVDLKLNYSQINERLINIINNINRLSGANFKPISVCITDVEVFDSNTMKDKHTKFNYYDMVFLKWNDVNLYKEIQCERNHYTCLDVIGELQISKFAGRKQIQFIISDYDNVNKYPNYLKNC